MKLALQVQLTPADDAAEKLTATTARFNEAANWLVGIAFERRCANKIDLQKIAYRELRSRFGLSSQMAILCVRRVCEAYKRDRSIRPEFRPDAAIAYDARTLSFKGTATASILTLAGRVIVPMVMGDHQRERFALPKGQSDLLQRKDGKWFLFVTVDAPEPEPIDVKDVIGIDLGVVNLAVDSTGEVFSGEQVETVRRHYNKHRADLQRCGTKSAKRRLCKTKKRESRFRKDTNHRIAKHLVAKAKDTNAAIALEDLSGVIGDGTRFGKGQRNRMKGWAFAQLRSFITYKAALAGVTVIPVDPAYTSRTCSRCGHCEKANRRNRNDFRCMACSFECCADHNASLNIRSKGITAFVGMPIVGIVDAGHRNPAEITYKPLASAMGS